MTPLDQFISALEAALRGRPSRKPRDPVERALLLEAGDPIAAREDPSLLREAGERPCRANTWERPA